MNRLLRSLALAAVLAAGAALLSACGTGTTYYFSTSGNDANNCTTTSTPCRTLSKTGGRLAGLSLGPDDQVLLKAGDTWSGDFVKITASGTADSYIIVGTWNGSSPKPIITNAVGAAGAGSSCVEVTGNYVSVRGLGLDSCGTDPTDLYYAGMTISGDHVDATFDRVKDNHVGIKTKHGADFATLQFNHLVDNNLWQKTPSVNCSNQAQAIDLEGNDAQVNGNDIEGSITSTSCDGGTHGSAIEVFGGSRNIITRNTVSSSKSFSEMGVDQGTAPAADNVYSWNVVYNNDPDHSGVDAMRGLITRGDADTTYGPVTNTIFKNNTIRFKSDSTSGVDLQGIVCGGGCADSGTTVLHAKNNIVSIAGPSGSGTMKAIFGNNVDSNYNLYHCSNVSLSTCVNGSMTLGAADHTGCTSGCGGYLPGFVDGSTNPPNLHLISTSSNCNSGTTSYDNSDHDGETVPQGTGYDRGAYEDC